MEVISCMLMATSTTSRLVLIPYLFPVLVIFGFSATAQESRTDNGPIVPNVRIECSLKQKAAEPVEAETFVAQEHFKEDITPTAQVRISWLGATFARRFAVKVETATDRCLQTCILENPSNDNRIIGELGIPDETNLADIWRLLRRQANGESGALLTNAAPNIFFVRDRMSALGVVDVLWGGAGWEIGASPIGKQRTWPPGTRVFFHGPDNDCRALTGLGASAAR
ncbi:hypothetical protein MTX26_35455 (plasmid) [Bradyrhizobium sp. ISRA443]|uniref:hypothetical protein n=1 Tax=unclassified Bradyrhizobium TaxID=2631580 RepID=UPI00247A89B2|nr:MULTISPECIES: hypothetical protein [unclassified Bradyrhizobium]WGR90728.1 hypothetical protein MTX20_01320 [Bradyrhizobium sp. ISRA435]WGS03140.1 hypothetical protein MTX23_35165 [Bradyrhizobium sp. ISRA436]WGS10066.1 hypothetical protein MTX18_35455 [Bradyrhizobium sp. ISRA437]WGS16951.1 hypothetical protein MTX26_35455 [Bradyrhizobium sp. ISRA443]